MATFTLSGGRTVELSFEVIPSGDAVRVQAIASDDDSRVPWALAFISEEGISRCGAVGSRLGIALDRHRCIRDL